MWCDGGQGLATAVGDTDALVTTLCERYFGAKALEDSILFSGGGDAPSHAADLADSEGTCTTTTTRDMPHTCAHCLYAHLFVVSCCVVCLCQRCNASVSPRPPKRWSHSRLDCITMSGSLWLRSEQDC